ncbi:MAG: tryptophanase [Thermoplasmata archaeon]|nr:tryptophanase [Thermoplasmata archaeon]
MSVHVSVRPREVRAPPEPYKVKVVEAIPDPSLEQREAALVRGGFNLFNLTSDEVHIDLLTDSGTSAMSDRQWSAMMVGDESYAGSRNFARFEATVQTLTGFPHVIPTHQGRAAENLLFSTLVRAGHIVPNNMHFDTTRTHVLRNGATPVNLVVRAAYDCDDPAPFKGNVDVDRLERLLDGEGRGKVPLVMVTLTNNTGGGQPVSLRNLEEVSTVCRAASVPLYLDMCRWAENAYFIRERERGQGSRSIREIGRSIFDLAEGATMSAKKDGLVNIGGFLVTRDAALADKLREALIVFEGFPTYGGLARRDLEAMAVGLEEATELPYLEHRIGQVRYLAALLDAEGIPFMRPPGGHGIYLDARRFLPHLGRKELPGQALVVEIYREGGVRTVEVGGIMFGDADGGTEISEPLELVRLAIPRRVYSASHLEFVAEVIAKVHRRRNEIRGMRMVHAPEHLRHFTARFEPLAPPAPAEGAVASARPRRAARSRGSRPA